MEQLRYLKRFNESIDSKLDFQMKLKSFSEEYLAYLIDEGYSVSVRTWGTNLKVVLHTNQKFAFSWSDIKDDFISFYEMLKEKYSLFDYYGAASAYLKGGTEPCYVELGIDNKVSNKAKDFDLYDSLIYSDDFEKDDILSVEIIVNTK